MTVTRLSNVNKESSFTLNAADYYDSHPEVHYEGVFKDALDAIRFLKEHRKDDSSLSYLMLAEWTAGRVPEDKLMNWQLSAGAADYAMAKQKMIEQEIAKVYSNLSGSQRNSSRVLSYLKDSIDRSRFTYLRNETKTISNAYFNLVMRYAMELYGNELVRGLS